MELYNNPYNTTFNQYGEGGGHNINYYKVNRDEGTIVFKNVPQTKVYLEYLTNGITLDEQTKFPRRLFNALLSAVMYQLAVESMDTPPAKVQLLATEMSRQMKLLKANEKGFNKSEFLDILYKNKKQSPHA